MPPEAVGPLPATLPATRIRSSPREAVVHRFAVVAAGCSLVAACAGTVREGMAKLEGQPLSAVIARIGPPLDERKIAGQTVYIWGSLEMTPPKGSHDKTCQIRATMNGDIVVSLDYQGDESLCQRYAARLQP